MDYPIRNVAFGGFDRQDVVRYLESFSRTAAEEKQTLQAENDRLNARTEELEQENRELRTQLEEARAQSASLQKELDRETARREALEALRELEVENTRLRAEASALRRDAEAYARFRERVGSIECEARERADALEAGASEKMRQTMLQFQERYQELIRIIESTAGHVTGELRKVEVNLSQLPRAMDQADRELEDLSGQISRGEYAPGTKTDGTGTQTPEAQAVQEPASAAAEAKNASAGITVPDSKAAFSASDSKSVPAAKSVSDSKPVSPVKPMSDSKPVPSVSRVTESRTAGGRMFGFGARRPSDNRRPG